MGSTPAHHDGGSLAGNVSKRTSSTLSWRRVRFDARGCVGRRVSRRSVCAATFVVGVFVAVEIVDMSLSVGRTPTTASHTP